MSWEILWPKEEMPDLDDETLRLLVRGRFKDGAGNIIFRLNAARFYAALAGKLPSYGPRSDGAREDGAWGGFSTELYRGSQRRFPVVHLSLSKWRVADIDSQAASVLPTPRSVVGLVETGRGYQVIMRGGLRSREDAAYFASLPSDPQYRAGSVARRLWNLRTLHKFGKGTPRKLYLVGGNERERAALAAAWRAAGGEVEE